MTRKPGLFSLAGLLLGAFLLSVASLLLLVGGFSSGVPIVIRVGLVLLGSVFLLVGGAIYRTAKQFRATSGMDLLLEDPRHPVVYLRAFKDDPVADQIPDVSFNGIFSLTASEEEQIAEVFGEFGPFVAIGRPGELLPQLGAARLYVAHDEWQPVVTMLMLGARLVVFRATNTAGFLWELNHSATILKPHQRLFLIPRNLEYESFRKTASLSLGLEFPAKKWSKQPCGSLAGIVYFTRAGEGTFLYPVNPIFRHQVRTPLVPILKTMLQPVFAQEGLPWSRPPIRWGLYGMYFFVLGILPMTGIIFALLVGEVASAIGLLMLVGGLHAFVLTIARINYLRSQRG